MKLPDFPKKGGTVEKTVIDIIRFLTASRIVGVSGGQVKESPNGTSIVIDNHGKSKSGKTPPPFHVSLLTSGTRESPTYKASVYYGRVCDRIPGDVDAVTYYEPYNLTWGADGATQDPPQPAGNPRTFGITVGQQVTIVVYTDNLGNVGGSAAPSEGPVVITVGAEDAHESTHYRPPAGDDDYGAEGIYYYKMAVIRSASGGRPAYLEKFLSGSNIDNWHELPNVDNLDNTGSVGTARVLKRIDPAIGKYELRTLVEFDPGLDYGVKVTEESDTVKLDTKGGNLNLHIQDQFQDTDAFIFNVGSPRTLYFRKGIYVGKTDPGGTLVGTLDEETVSNIDAI